MAAHQDNQLIEAYAAYVGLVAEIEAYEADLPAEAPPHPRDGELEDMLDRLCAARATTLAGVASRLQWLLRWDPYLIEDWDQGGGHDERMVAALLRDLHDLLDPEIDDQALAGARARGERLAGSWQEADRQQLTDQKWHRWGELGLKRMRKEDWPSESAADSSEPRGFV